MNLPPIISSISKQQIVDMFVATRQGKKTEEDFQRKFDEVLQYVYDCGREMGMTESLNYVANEADRQRLFEVIDQLNEELDNAK